MLTLKMLTLALSLAADPTTQASDAPTASSETVVMKDHEGNGIVLEGGSRVLLVSPTGQVREWRTDGSIVVREPDGRTWSL